MALQWRRFQWFEEDALAVPEEVTRVLSHEEGPSCAARGPGGEALLLQSDAAGALHVLDGQLRLRSCLTPHAVQSQRLQHLHQVRRPVARLSSKATTRVWGAWFHAMTRLPGR